MSRMRARLEDTSSTLTALMEKVSGEASPMARLQEAGQRVASLNWLHRYSIWLLASLPPPICPSLFFALFLFGSMQFDWWKLRLHSIFLLVDLGIGVLFSFFLLLFSYPEIDMLSQHSVSEIHEACAVIIVSNGRLTNLMSGENRSRYNKGAITPPWL